MRRFSCFYLLGTLVLTASGCKKDKTDINSILCAPTSSYALPVEDLEGVIQFNQALQQYVIARHVPATIDVVDIGVPCGDVPGYLRTAGLKVRFSGIYRGYSQPPTAPAGTTYYYLEVSKVSII